MLELCAVYMPCTASVQQHLVHRSIFLSAWAISNDGLHARRLGWVAHLLESNWKPTGPTSCRGTLHKHLRLYAPGTGCKSGSAKGVVPFRQRRLNVPGCRTCSGHVSSILWNLWLY